MGGRIRMAEGMDVDVAAGVEFPRTYGSARRVEWFLGKMLRKCCAGMWMEMCFCRGLRCSKRGVETGNDRLFHVGELIPRPKNDGRHERTNARASFAHDGDKHLFERKHRRRSLHSP